MITSTSQKTGTNHMPPKRSLFNKPSWSKPHALINDTDLFHRSNQTYVDLATEAERQRKKKRARKERERARQAENEGRAGKRLRVSESEDDDSDSSSSDDSSRPTEPIHTHNKATESKNEQDPRAGSPAKPEHSPKSLLKRYEAKVAANQSNVTGKERNVGAQILDLEDDQDEVSEKDSEPEITIVRPPEPVIEDDEPVSDDEFPELARQARERARRKRLEEDMASASPDLAASQDGRLHQSQNLHPPTPPPIPPDPVIQILITSSIPDTVPLIVNRLVSQRLKDVRLAWTQRQQFSSEFSDKVFLTWRRKRLFDVTTCKSLGITAGPNGGVLAKGEYVGDDEGRIHMEAMTSEILEAHKKAERQDLQDSGDIDADQNDVVEQKEPQIKIICKAKGFDDFKLIVKPVCITCHSRSPSPLTRNSLPLSRGSAMPFVRKTRLVERKRFICYLTGTN